MTRDWLAVPVVSQRDFILKVRHCAEVKLMLRDDGVVLDQDLLHSRCGFGSPIIIDVLDHLSDFGEHRTRQLLVLQVGQIHQLLLHFRFADPVSVSRNEIFQSIFARLGFCLLPLVGANAEHVQQSLIGFGIKSDPLSISLVVVTLAARVDLLEANGTVVRDDPLQTNISVDAKLLHSLVPNDDRNRQFLRGNVELHLDEFFLPLLLERNLDVISVEQDILATAVFHKEGASLMDLALVDTFQNHFQSD